MSDEDDFFDTEGDTPQVRTFTASYDSICSCGVLIVEGDLAGYIGDDDEASCAACILTATI